MVWTVLALVLWVVLGGFISYYGDLQGRRWGKRRVSWFGLRPKHTAILITSLTGGFIALFSVVSLMIIVPTVRDVVTHGENAIQENKRLLADETKQKLLDKLDRDKRDRENRIKQAATDKQIADGRRDLANLQKQKADLQSRIAPLMASVLGLQTHEVKLTASINSLETKIARLSAKIASEDRTNKDLATRIADLGNQKGKLERSNNSLLSSNNSLKQNNAYLVQVGEKAKVSNNSFYRYNSDLEKDKNALEKQIADLNHDKQEAIEVIRKRDEAREQLQDLTLKIAKNYSMLRQGHVVLRAGVELGRISMDAHLRPEAIKRQVSFLIATASEQAKRFGAADGDNGMAATMPQKRKPTLTGYENKDQDAQVESLAEEWSGSDSSNVVVATTVANCLAGEPAFIDLRRYPVVRIFAKGAEVASRTIDGNSKVEVIIDNLMSFLQKDVQKSAIQAGIIPRVDPETGLSEVGVLGTADLFKLTDTVRRMGGSLVLTARTKQDVSSGDSLDLSFRVTRLSAPPQTAATD